MIRRPPRSTHCISSAASDVYKRQHAIDPVIGMTIDVPDDFDEKEYGEGQASAASSFVDVPLCLSASARHVRNRSASMVDLSACTIGSNEDARTHPQPPTEPMLSLSLPAALCIVGSWEDRFAGCDKTRKTDKMMHVPMKIRGPSVTPPPQLRSESRHQQVGNCSKKKGSSDMKVGNCYVV